jgi:hypothetical protein
MAEVAQSGGVARRTFTVHVRPNDTSWSLSVYGLNGGTAEVALVDQVEGVARTLISLALNLRADAFDVVVRVLADASACWLHTDVPMASGDHGGRVALRSGRGFRGHR